MLVVANFQRGLCKRCAAGFYPKGRYLEKRRLLDRWLLGYSNYQPTEEQKAGFRAALSEQVHSLTGVKPRIVKEWNGAMVNSSALVVLMHLVIVSFVKACVSVVGIALCMKTPLNLVDMWLKTSTTLLTTFLLSIIASCLRILICFVRKLPKLVCSTASKKTIQDHVAGRLET